MDYDVLLPEIEFSLFIYVREYLIIRIEQIGLKIRGKGITGAKTRDNRLGLG